MHIQTIRDHLDRKHNMRKRGDVYEVSDVHGHYMISLGVVRQYVPARREEINPKTDIYYPEMKWADLKKKAKDAGLFRVGMNKEQVIKALNGK